LELRAAGVFSRQRVRKVTASRFEGAPAAPSAELGFEDLQRAPPAERCVWLLRLLVQALRRSGRLKRESTLTYRELIALPLFDDRQQRARFERLALLAERQRYGSLSLDSEQWAQMLDDGRSLYAHWLQPALPQGQGNGASAPA